jgi:hypothetical protein
MRRVALAEWILALTVAPDRAATTVGDLVEDASTRGVLWFWSSVLWTALSHLWRDLSAAPFRLVKLALWGCVVEFLLLIVSTEGIIYICGQIDLNIRRLRGYVECSSPCGFYWPGPLWAEKMIIYSLGVIIVPFLVGWMVGQLSRGKELAAAFTLAFVSVVIHSLYAWELTREQVNHPELNFGTPDTSIITVWIPLLFVFGGAIAFRWLVGSRRLRASGA